MSDMIGRIVGWTVGLALVVAVFGPLVALMLDSWCWLMAGSFCTSVPWDATRMQVAILLPFVVLLLAAPFMG